MNRIKCETNKSIVRYLIATNHIILMPFKYVGTYLPTFVQGMVPTDVSHFRFHSPTPIMRDFIFYSNKDFCGL